MGIIEGRTIACTLRVLGCSLPFAPRTRAPQKTLTAGAAPLAPHLLQWAKADNSAVFVGLGFFLLSGRKSYRIAHNYEIVGGDRLIDSLSSKKGG